MHVHHEQIKQLEIKTWYPENPSQKQHFPHLGRTHFSLSELSIAQSSFETDGDT